eukprot:scaffold563934_cov50-Prasinocladus_malaysianus.AAC.1
MDPDQARQLMHAGATLLLLDVPEGTAIGLDHQHPTASAQGYGHVYCLEARVRQSGRLRSRCPDFSARFSSGRT